MAACDCRSHNSEIGTVPEVVLPRPWFMAEGERPNGVPVDACIAAPVEHLWARGVVTLGSCCGHGGRTAERPSIVLGEGIVPGVARALLAEVDGRGFDLYQWRLVAV